MMTQFFLRIYDYASAHRRLSAAVLLLFLAVVVLLTVRIHYEEDISKFLPGNEENEQYEAIYKQITSQDRIAVLFGAKDSLRQVPDDTLEMAMDYMGRRLEQIRSIRDLQVTVDAARAEKTMDFVYRNMPYFLSPADYERMDSLLAQPDFVHNQMLKNRQLALMPMGGALMQTLRYDPLGLFGPVMQRLKGLGPSEDFQLADGYVFTKDGKRSLLTFHSPYGPSETGQNALLVQQLNGAMAATMQQYPNMRVSAIGAPLVAVTNAQQIKTDSLVSVSLAVVLILFLLVWHYRRLSDILWIGASIAFGWLFALAGMSLASGSVSIIVLGIGSVIIGIAVNYPLHFLDHLREVPGRREALREMVPPLLIGNITTVAAFLCLVWLDARAMRDLGLFGSLMLIGTILFVLVFLPLYAKASAVSPRAIGSSRVRLPRVPYLLPVVLLLTAVLGYFSLRTSFDSDLSHINYMTPEQQADMELLSSSLPDRPVYVVARGATLEEALRENDRATDKLMALPQVERISGVGSFLPSEPKQEARLARWRQFKARYAQSLLAAVDREGRALGFSGEAFGAFSELLTQRFEVRAASYFSLLTANAASGFILKDGSGYKIVNYVTTSDEAAVKRSVPLAFSSRDISNRLVEVLNNSFNYIGWVCGLVVFCFLWLSFGSIELSLLSFLPLAVSWVWILGLMQLLGVQFNIVNIILATFIFGQGDDYTIFITEGLMYEYATGRRRLQAYRNSVLFSAVLMFIGIGSLIFARHPALRSLAVVTIIGMVTVVLMANYLPPLVFRWLTTKDGQRRPVPITLKRVAYSLFSLFFFLGMMYGFMLPYTWLYFRIGKITEARKLKYHRIIQRMAQVIVRRVPGVKYSEDNSVGETFEKPSVIICNHQSHLDLLCLLQLTPKLVFVTNDWVWRNPFYGAVIHRAEFYPVSDGIERNMPRLRDLYGRGYSICVFPEGTRSEDCSILRFHKGAFYLARELGADIVPVFLHGAGHVLPKRDFMLREGAIHVEIGQRRPAGKAEGMDANESDRLMSRHMRKYYQEHYAALCAKLETEEYWAPYRRYDRMYKGEFR